MDELPIYKLQNFNCNLSKGNLYINTFKKHLITHSFIENSHRHDFYLLVLFTAGSGIHKIDMESFEISKGSLFVIKPGQAHSWKLSKDINGYIVFYTEELYNLYFGNKKIEEYSFYKSCSSISKISLDKTELIEIEDYFKLLVKENQKNKSRREDKLLNILDIIHIEISRKHMYENDTPFLSYNHKMKSFSDLLDLHYKSEKSPSFYASKMNITLKHLNRICKDILNKTVTELISQKMILESKRMLTFSTKPINEIAEELGYINYSYFTKLFKKHTGFTPTKFRANLKLEQW